MPSDNNLKIILNSMILTMLSLLLSLSGCPEEPENNDDPDTTSHEFSWQTWTFGELGSSHFRDVAIVDENNIWAVGEITVYDPDSSFNGTGWETFNAARWVGEKWNLMRTWGPVSLNSIWYFSENDIWVSSGYPEHWDGNQWTLYHFNDMGLGANVSTEHIWASSPTDIYFVGYQGSIVHYDGSIFRKIESGTTLSINDIRGSYNSKTKQYEILAVASNRALDAGRKVLKISGNQVTAVVDSGLPWSINSIFFIPGVKYYIVGDGVYESASIKSSSIWKLWPSGKMTNYYSEKIRGTGSNDIFIVGHQGEIVHYNGNSWRNYISQTGLGYGFYLSVAFKDDLVVAVGQNYNQAVITVGKR